MNHVQHPLKRDLAFFHFAACVAQSGLLASSRLLFDGDAIPPPEKSKVFFDLLFNYSYCANRYEFIDSSQRTTRCQRMAVRESGTERS